jgi:hypothetical protein
MEIFEKIRNTRNYELPFQKDYQHIATIQLQITYIQGL